MSGSEFQSGADAHAGRVQLDVVRRTELKILDLAAQEDVPGEGVIDAEAGGEAENIFAATLSGLGVRGANVDASFTRILGTGAVRRSHVGAGIAHRHRAGRVNLRDGDAGEHVREEI